MSQLKTHQHYDAVIIGAGIVGLTIAYCIASREKRVAIVDAGQAGQGTSNNTFAWINASTKLSDQAYHDLNARGVRGYRELAKRWGEREIGVHFSGLLQWGNHPENADLIKNDVQKLMSWGYPTLWMEKSALQAMEPHVMFSDNSFCTSFLMRSAFSG